MTKRSSEAHQVENMLEQVHRASAMETVPLWPNFVSKSSLSGAENNAINEDNNDDNRLERT